MKLNSRYCMLFLGLACSLVVGCAAEGSTGDAAENGSTQVLEGTERDLRLCGNWRRTVSSSSRGPDSNLYVTSDFHLQLSPSGRFVYTSGGAGSYGGGLGGAYIPVGLGPVSGTWKTEGGVLWYRLDGGRQWVPAGGYHMAGGSVMISTAAATVATAVGGMLALKIKARAW